MDRKLVKEVTGHRSDAIDCYQITSDEQRQKLSEIIACSNTENVPNKEETLTKATEISKESDLPNKNACTCTCSKHSPKMNNIAEIISEVVERNLKTGKFIIKVKIEINNV